MKKFILASIFVAFSIMSIHFVLPAYAADPKYGGTLTIADIHSPALLDPHKDGSYQSSVMTLPVIYECLLNIDPTQDDKLIPGLASSWEVKNPTEFVFTLRKGVKFHNGREMVAEDVKYSFERVKDPKTGCPFRSYLEPIQEMEIIDPYKIRIVLKSPYAPFLRYMAGNYGTFIVPKEEVEKNGDLNKVAVGTGPFKMVEYVPGSHMKLIKNNDYWKKGLPYLDGIVFRYIKDESARIAAMRTKSVDITYISHANSPMMKKEKGIKVISDFKAYYGATLGQFLPNCSRKPFTDKRVRMAMSLVVDRQQILDTVLFGDGEIAGPISMVYKEFALRPNYKLDIPQAKKLLAEAGYPNGFETTIMAPPEYPDNVAYAQIIKQNLKQIGIEAKINTIEWGVFLKEWLGGNYDTAVLTSGPLADPDAFMYDYFHSKSPRNRTKFLTGELDDLVTQQRETVDVEKRKKLLYDIQKKILDDIVPNIYLYSEYGLELHQDYIKGYKSSNLTRYYFSEAWRDK